MQTETASMREAFGEALVEVGERHPEVVVLDADVCHSTRTLLFAERFPERFYNLGIAEANMMDIAAGLATTGAVPWVSTFSFLASLRAGEQIRTSIAYPKLNVKIAGGYAGLSDSFDGPTHQSVFDLAVMRAMPNMTVVAAADGPEAKAAVKAASIYPGPVYLRLSRAEVPVVFREGEPEFRIGQGRVLRDGADVSLVATGVMVSRALAAAERLVGEGVAARVIEIHTLKPIDEGLLLNAAEETGALVTVEEHSVIGGLGGAVAETLAQGRPTPVEMVGLRDTFAESGAYEALLDAYGLSVGEIVAAAQRALARKARV
jgi:transketolase